MSSWKLEMTKQKKFSIKKESFLYPPSPFPPPTVGEMKHFCAFKKNPYF
jgi:hypothetical protein